MFGKLFGRNEKTPGTPEGAAPAYTPSAPSMTQAERLRSVAGSSSAERAAEMLIGPAALMQLSLDEARIIVSHMRPHRIANGTTVIREGDVDKTDFMLLILDGEVTIDHRGYLQLRDGGLHALQLRGTGNVGKRQHPFADRQVLDRHHQFCQRGRVAGLCAF